MTRLDEIRERYNHSRGRSSIQPSTALEDIGYLLSLLDFHPASEPPDTDRTVLAKYRGELRKARYCTPGDRKPLWRGVGFATSAGLEWQELPEGQS